MKSLSVLIVVILKIFCIESGVLPEGAKIFMQTSDDVADASQSEEDDEGLPIIYPPVIVEDGPEYEMFDGVRYEVAMNKKKKPCTVIVLSESRTPSMQSLVRKYRYDSKGSLIPSSVRYYVKVPQTGNEKALLVKVNDKAFTPLGGFIRFYKEVPPIPQSM